MRRRLRSLLDAAARRRRVAAHATLCIATPLIVLVALGHPTGAVIATQGGFAGFYAFDAPLARRGRIVAGVGAGLVLAAFAGTLVAQSPVLIVLVGGVFAMAAAFVCVALETGPPREYFLVFAFLIATGLPPDPSAAPGRAAFVFAGAATAWAIAMGSGRRDPERPAREAVDAAFAAVAGLVAAVGSDGARDAQHHAVLAVRRALVTAEPGTPFGRRAEAAETLLEAAQSLVIGSSPPLDPAWVEAVRDPEKAPVVDALPPLPAGRRLAYALAAVQAGAAAAPDPVHRRSWTEALRDGRQPHSFAPVAAIRVGVAVAAGSALGAVVGGHGYWIALSAAAVLQGSNVRVTLRRATDRTVGTLVGLVGAAAILAPHPPVGLLVAVVVVLQFVTESVVVASYGIAVVFITSLALVLLEIAHPAFGAGLLGARAADTVAGCAIGLAAGMLLWSRRSAVRLASAQAAALRAAGAALAAGLRGAPAADLRALRRTAHVRALNLRAVHRDATADLLRGSPGADDRWPLTHAIEHFVSVATSLPRRDPSPALADAAERTVEALAEAAEGRPTEPPALVLPRFPATERALGQVRDALS